MDKIALYITTIVLNGNVLGFSLMTGSIFADLYTVQGNKHMVWSHIRISFADQKSKNHLVQHDKQYHMKIGSQSDI